MSSVYYIYLITCIVNGRQYVGMTGKTPDKRWAAHIRAAKRGAEFSLSYAIRKHGALSFTIETLFTAFSKDCAIWAERHLIADLSTISPRGYNLTTGGESHSGFTFSEETRAKISQKSKAAWNDPVRGAKMRTAMSEAASRPEHVEHLRRLSAKKKGVKHTDEHAANIANALIGHSVSDEAREKMRRKWADPEYRAHLSSALKKSANKWSPERRAEQAERMRVRYARQKHDSSSLLEEGRNV